MAAAADGADGFGAKTEMLAMVLAQSCVKR